MDRAFHDCGMHGQLASRDSPAESLADNMALRLSQMYPEQYDSLLRGTESIAVHVLGRQLEVVIDSFAQLGGIGLDYYRELMAAFKKNIGWTSISIFMENHRSEVCI